MNIMPEYVSFQKLFFLASLYNHEEKQFNKILKMLSVQQQRIFNKKESPNSEVCSDFLKKKFPKIPSNKITEPKTNYNHTPNLSTVPM